ncbi:DUF6412 domain-containing protein [Nocardia sp. NBC_00416]|uniref:DUF6412 domain-containing protein n=1 Tax=Nocardia sp. NBC_00416 TaxID=2975991 RepID=UPI002E24D330
MARIWSVVAHAVNLVQLAWVAALTLAITVALVGDGPTAVVGAAVAITILLGLAEQGGRSGLRPPAESATGPSHEERRLRGAFRRQSAPDTPGRPRLPRAPGQVSAAA